MYHHDLDNEKSRTHHLYNDSVKEIADNSMAEVLTRLSMVCLILQILLHPC